MEGRSSRKLLRRALLVRAREYKCLRDQSDKCESEMRGEKHRIGARCVWLGSVMKEAVRVGYMRFM